jgi:endonuclease-8
VPEGDTVWNTARVLERALAGKALTASDFRVPKLATADLTGWTVAESASRGKHLLLRLTGPDDDRRLTLHSHLRMDGAWRAYEKGQRWAGRPAHLIRVILRTADRDAVGYHLHELALVPTDQEHTLVGHLGPDLLGADWDADEAVRRLLRRPELTIGEALLDQRNVAGMGTVWRAEVLFLSGIHPWTHVRLVPDLGRPLGLARRMMVANKGRWDQVTTGDRRRGHQHWVYGRFGDRCRRCDTPILRGSQGPTGEERVVYWCPRCQPAVEDERGRSTP